MIADERRAKVRETLRDLHGQATSVNKALDQLDALYRDWFLELIDNEIPEDDEYGYRKTLSQQLTAALGKDGDENP
jgi:hypothetical protein